jgi:hypothetical protein
MCVRRQRAPEEPKRFDKALMLSFRLQSSTASVYASSVRGGQFGAASRTRCGHPRVHERCKWNM